MKKIFIYTVIIFAFFAIGLLLANFILMPYLVHMGEKITVPDVCNMPLEDALKELKKHGLEGVVVERRYDPIIEAGKVIIQEPLPDAETKKGRIINLSVSLGPETIKIPYLTGVDIEKGKLILVKLNLAIETIDSVYSDSVAIGKIISTVPDFGSEVKNGEHIKIFVSKGTILKMPNLIGVQLNEARDVLKKIGLVIGEIKEVEARGIKGNIVLQNPEALQPIAAGDTVSLIVIK